ncbi:MAG: hypothetical protein ABSH32_21635 [Bryobacteraceae bacterium]|jgi:hypothetical protein
MSQRNNPLRIIEAELHGLREQKREIDTRIEALEKSAELLRPMYPERKRLVLPVGEQDESAGITARIREIFAKSKYPLTPLQVRDTLEAGGLPVSQYTNGMATIHQILKRLVAGGYVKQLTQNERRAYQQTPYQPLGPDNDRYSTWFTKEELMERWGITEYAFRELVLRVPLKKAKWRRPTGGPKIMVYDPDDVEKVDEKYKKRESVQPVTETG